MAVCRESICDLLPVGRGREVLCPGTFLKYRDEWIARVSRVQTLSQIVAYRPTEISRLFALLDYAFSLRWLPYPDQDLETSPKDNEPIIAIRSVLLLVPSNSPRPALTTRQANDWF